MIARARNDIVLESECVHACDCDSAVKHANNCSSDMNLLTGPHPDESTM